MPFLQLRYEKIFCTIENQDIFQVSHAGQQVPILCHFPCLIGFSSVLVSFLPIFSIHVYKEYYHSVLLTGKIG